MPEGNSGYKSHHIVDNLVIPEGSRQGYGIIEERSKYIQKNQHCRIYKHFNGHNLKKGPPLKLFLKIEKLKARKQAATKKSPNQGSYEGTGETIASHGSSFCDTREIRQEQIFINCRQGSGKYPNRNNYYGRP